MEYDAENVGALMSWHEGVSIGIPTYNRAHGVEQLLKNIRQRTPASIPYEIIVCDDSGKLEHQTRVRKICADYDAKFIFNQKNSGVATSWNRMVRFSIREMFVLLNDDVLLANDWLTYLQYAVMENQKAGSFSLNCRFITESDVPAILQGPQAKVIPLNVHWRDNVLIRNERFPSFPAEEDSQPGRVMCPAGCAFGFRRDMYEEVGGFDQRYFAFYEETDFGVACSYRGHPAYTLSVPGDNYHIWSATFGSAPEIPAGQIMMESRHKFVDKWTKVLGFHFMDAPDVHTPIMSKIGPQLIKWLGSGKTPRQETLT